MNNEILNFINQEFNSLKSNEVASWSTSYMKNKFKFLGVKKPLIKNISLLLLKKFNLSLDEVFNLATVLYQKDYREYQYLSIYLLDKFAKKLSEKHLEELEKMVLKDSWWDSVDTLSSNIIGILLQKLSIEQRRVYLNKWENSGNMWLLRVCIIHQLKYKKDTDKNYLAYICTKAKLHKDFFIRKAIGWALRDFSKTDYSWVKTFVDNNQDLSPLSKKEALRLFNN